MRAVPAGDIFCGVGDGAVAQRRYQDLVIRLEGERTQDGVDAVCHVVDEGKVVGADGMTLRDACGYVLPRGTALEGKERPGRLLDFPQRLNAGVQDFVGRNPITAMVEIGRLLIEGKQLLAVRSQHEGNL